MVYALCHLKSQNFSFLNIKMASLDPDPYSLRIRIQGSQFDTDPHGSRSGSATPPLIKKIWFTWLFSHAFLKVCPMKKRINVVPVVMWLTGWRLAGAEGPRHGGVDGDEILRLWAAGEGRHGGTPQDAGPPSHQRVEFHVQAVPGCTQHQIDKLPCSDRA